MLNSNRDTCLPGYNKVYIEMYETVTAEGRVLPQRFKWVSENSEAYYDVDKVLDVKETYAPNVGGLATRYRVLVGGREKLLWYEGPKWFVEMYCKRM